MSALHEVDVFDFDRAATAEVNHHDGKPDRGLRRRDGQHEHRQYLPDKIAERSGKRDEVQIYREQDQLDRHQDNNDVFSIKKYPEYPKHQQNRADGKIMPDPHCQHDQCPSVSDCACETASIGNSAPSCAASPPSLLIALLILIPISSVPANIGTCRISKVSRTSRSSCTRIICLRGMRRSRSVSTIAPIIATKSKRPAN